MGDSQEIYTKYEQLQSKYIDLANEFGKWKTEFGNFRLAFCDRTGLPTEDMTSVTATSHVILQYLDFMRDRFFVQSHGKRAIENMNPPSLATHPVVNSLEKEIDSLKSELEHCHAEIDDYQKTLQTLEKPKYQIFDRNAMKFHLENLKTWIRNKTDINPGLAAHDVAEIYTRIDAMLEKVT